MNLIQEIVAWLESIFTGLSAGVQKPSQAFGASQILATIRARLTVPLGLPDAAAQALFAQAYLETDGFKAHEFLVTKSLWNRHAGSGKGYWTGSTFYVSPGDSDLRIYSSIAQSCMDMGELLQDPYYSRSLAALQRGDVVDYFKSLEALGFSTQKGYAFDLMRTFNDFA